MYVTMNNLIKSNAIYMYSTLHTMVTSSETMIKTHNLLEKLVCQNNQQSGYCEFTCKLKQMILKFGLE